MMKLALSVPGLNGQTTIDNPPGFKFVGTNGDLNSVISATLQLGIYVAFVLAMSWLAWGVFQYIVAGGNKENLARARVRITWAIVGLVIVLLAWAVTRFVGDIFNPQNVTVTNVSTP